eukprot:TRINITY_DN1293_c5_g1_i1.p1 TRINITY_DN1293_c5_g1~~TRINITY_DN1293_c5_g1_i1.p1  ORF type:complete len:439 (+),score=113.57 TRINITY_DN1293_c5_g1_i1:86-1402(+)
MVAQEAAHAPRSRSRSRSRGRRHKDHKDHKDKKEKKDKKRHKEKKEERERRTGAALVPAPAPADASDSDSSTSSSAARRRRRRRKHSGWNALAPAVADPQVAAAQNSILGRVGGLPGGALAGPARHRLYVGSVSYEVGEREVRAVFSPYGLVVDVTMLEDDATGHHRGFAFVEFDTAEALQQALAAGRAGHITFFGRPCKVDLPAPVPAFGQPAFGGPAPGSHGAPQPPQTVQSIDSEENVSISGGSARTALMRKLASGRDIPLPPEMPKPPEQATPPRPRARTNLLESDPALRNPLLGPPPASAAPPAPVPQAPHPAARAAPGAAQPAPFAAPPPGTSSVPTRVLCLLNMVLTPQDADAALERDVKDECSKFGQVLHVVIYDETQTDGRIVVKIFVEFAALDSAARCQRTMHGRFFDGRRIQALYHSEHHFQQILAL